MTKTQMRQPIELRGATGSNSHRVNGLFLFSDDDRHGHPVYCKDLDEDTWLFLSSDDRWAVADTRAMILNENRCYAYTEDFPPCPSLASAWEVLDADKWDFQPIEAEIMVTTQDILLNTHSSLKSLPLRLQGVVAFLQYAESSGDMLCLEHALEASQGETGVSGLVELVTLEQSRLRDIVWRFGLPSVSNYVVHFDKVEGSWLAHEMLQDASERLVIKTKASS